MVPTESTGNGTLTPPRNMHISEKHNLGVHAILLMMLIVRAEIVKAPVFVVRYITKRLGLCIAWIFRAWNKLDVDFFASHTIT